MPIEEIILAAIVDAVFGYITEKSLGKLEDWVSKKRGLSAEKKVFKEALGEAFEQFERGHRQWVEESFNLKFFERDGAPILAQFLLRDGHPNPSELAARWANMRNIEQPEARALYTRELEPVAADFLETLARQLKSKAELQEINNSRAFEQLMDDVQAIRRQLGAEQATYGTRHDYLRWLIGRNLYLDLRGIRQTQRQVQVKLEEVYVSLQTQREESFDLADRHFFEKELAKLAAQEGLTSLLPEEVEDRREQLLTRFEQRKAADKQSTAIALGEAMKRHERLVILGDPGCGKTTLLRYLALKHAQALQLDQSDAGDNLGKARFPIFIRIAEYAEDRTWKKKPLSDFLAESCILQECPKNGLADLLQNELKKGGCLILLDGLDEIVRSDERRGVVERIEDFVRHYDNNANHFIITSRVAGYRSAPLGEPFAHYIVQEMDETQIHHFLERWCQAVEDAQAPELSVQERGRAARQEIDGIMRAVQTSPGVHRLAVNPLLLTILALIHRTHGQLPQKRIELYKFAADTLAHAWRIAQRVPVPALVDDEYLTPMLGELAYYLHVHKATGIATEREVYSVLGKKWADLNGLLWDEDNANPKITEEVRKFLVLVREHTGLFVERAPKRYGFMHLTFEEYYVARHLVAKSRSRAKLIRRHLHDSRWEEPILLALGFVGLDYPSEASELLKTAILAEGEEAEELSFKSSPYEDLLGRDFLFALRCLGDDIPVHPSVMQPLSRRLCDELLHLTGSMSFQEYRQTLEKRFEYLRGSKAAAALAPLLVEALGDSSADIRSRAANFLGRLSDASPQVIAAFTYSLRDTNTDVRHFAAKSLGQLGNASREVIEALISTLGDADETVRSGAAESLKQLGDASPRVIDALILTLSDPSPSVSIHAAEGLGLLRDASPRVIDALLSFLDAHTEPLSGTAARSLRQLFQVEPQVVSLLISALNDKHPSVRRAAAKSLGRLDDTSSHIISALTSSLHDADPSVRRASVEGLAKIGDVSYFLVDSLAFAMRDADPSVRLAAVKGLAKKGMGMSTPLIVSVGICALNDTDPDIRNAAALGLLLDAPHAVTTALANALSNFDIDSDVRRDAAQDLERIGEVSPSVVLAITCALAKESRFYGWRGTECFRLIAPQIVSALIPALKSSANPDVRSAAAWGLAEFADATSPVISALVLALSDPSPSVQFSAAESLKRFDKTSPQVVSVFISALSDPDPKVRTEASWGLRQIGDRSSQVVTALVSALSDPDSGVRYAAAASLGGLGKGSPQVMAALVSALSDPDSGVRSRAAESLGQFGDGSPHVIAALVAALSDSDAQVRMKAADSLGELGDGSPHVVTALLLASYNPNFGFPSVTAAMSLERLAKTDPQVISAIIAALSNAEMKVRSAAVGQLGELAGTTPQLIAALVSALSDPDAKVRVNAADVLWKIGKPLPHVVAALTSALKDSVFGVRFTAALSLKQLGRVPPEAIVVLIEALRKAKDSSLRHEGAIALGYIRSSDPAIIDALWHGLLDKNSLVRISCSRSLAQVGQQSPTTTKEIASKLIRAINGEDFDKTDASEKYPSRHLAYEILWMLMTGNEVT